MYSWGWSGHDTFGTTTNRTQPLCPVCLVSRRPAVDQGGYALCTHMSVSTLVHTMSGGSLIINFPLKNEETEKTGGNEGKWGYGEKMEEVGGEIIWLTQKAPG